MEGVSCVSRRLDEYAGQLHITPLLYLKCSCASVGTLAAPREHPLAVISGMGRTGNAPAVRCAAFCTVLLSVEQWWQGLSTEVLSAQDVPNVEICLCGNLCPCKCWSGGPDHMSVRFIRTAHRPQWEVQGGRGPLLYLLLQRLSLPCRQA